MDDRPPPHAEEESDEYVDADDRRIGVAFRRSIWVLGGESQAQARCLASVLRFDPARSAWEESTALPTARNYARAAVLGDAIFVVGGSRSAGFSHASLGSTLVDSARLSAAPAPKAK